MPGRILNFSEFFSKYSKDGKNNQKALADFAKASDSFQDAFDENSYKQDNLGPNKPVAGGSEMTPAQPGEVGAPTFKSTSQSPTPEETPEQEEVETPEAEEKEETEGEEEETPEPEANESIKPLKGFKEYIKEDYTFGDSTQGSKEEFTAGLGHTGDEELDDDEVICQSCGSHKPLDGESPEEDSWFNEEFGMQCGCK